MQASGGCYCGAVRYEFTGEPTMKALCFCRECQHVSGGGPVTIMGVPADSFSYTKGKPNSFTRSGLERPVTREFCPTCGTHLTSRVPGLAAVLIKVGGLDDPSVFGMPQIAIYTGEKQAFHCTPEGVPAFESRPGR